MSQAFLPNLKSGRIFVAFSVSSKFNSTKPNINKSSIFIYADISLFSLILFKLEITVFKNIEPNVGINCLLIIQIPYS